MSCYDPCAHEQEILNRLATLEEELPHYVQTVNGVYGPFVTIDIPDLGPIEERVVILEDGQIDIIEEIAGLSFVESITGFTTSPTLVKMLFEMRDGTPVEKSFPVVSEVNQGVMTPSAYKQIFIDKQRIDQMISGTVIVVFDFATETPTQLQLTNQWIAVMERDPWDGDRILNLFDNVLYVFASGNWYTQSASATPQATNSTLGTMMGSLESGQCQVEMDGTVSVNDWDPTLERIDDLETGKLDKVVGVRQVYTNDVHGNPVTQPYTEAPSFAATIPISSTYGRLKSGSGTLGASPPIDNNDLTRMDYVDEKDNLRILKQQPIVDAGKILTVGDDGLVFNNVHSPLLPIQIRSGSPNEVPAGASVTYSASTTTVTLNNHFKTWGLNGTNGISLYYNNMIVKYARDDGSHNKGQTTMMYTILTNPTGEISIDTKYYPDEVTPVTVRLTCGTLVSGTLGSEIVNEDGDRKIIEIGPEIARIQTNGQLKFTIPAGSFVGCYSFANYSGTVHIFDIEVFW